MTDSNRPWFPARRHGWGWGLPVAWQGWAVVVACLLAVLAASILFPPDTRPGPFWSMVALSLGVLVAAGWLKGESPATRPQDRDGALPSESDQ